METHSPAPSRPNLLPAAFVIGAVALTGALFLAPVSDDTVRLASAFGSGATAVALVAALLGAARATGGPDRLAWSLLSVSTAIGTLAYTLDPVEFGAAAAAPAAPGSDDLVSAFVNLGYPAAQASKMAEEGMKAAPGASIPEQVRAALRQKHGG